MAQQPISSLLYRSAEAEELARQQARQRQPEASGLPIPPSPLKPLVARNPISPELERLIAMLSSAIPGLSTDPHAQQALSSGFAFAPTNLGHLPNDATQGYLELLGGSGSAPRSALHQSMREYGDLPLADKRRIYHSPSKFIPAVHPPKK